MEMVVFLRHKIWHHFPHMPNTIEIFGKSPPESLNNRSDLHSLELTVTTSCLEAKQPFHIRNGGDLVVV